MTAKHIHAPETATVLGRAPVAANPAREIASLARALERAQARARKIRRDLAAADAAVKNVRRELRMWTQALDRDDGPASPLPSVDDSERWVPEGAEEETP